MKKYNKLIGNYGEDLAIEFLLKAGYQIIERNFRCKLGEIDIIATKNNIMIFIEVKSRYSSKYGGTSEAISIQKRYKIINLAKYYLTITKTTDFFIRFDSIEINFSSYNSTYKISHNKDCFRTY